MTAATASLIGRVFPAILGGDQEPGNTVYFTAAVFQRKNKQSRYDLLNCYYASYYTHQLASV
jgi:CRISPR/Cas system CMR subunit Cmr6 (Cas7 group RAMP superfamily)